MSERFKASQAGEHPEQKGLHQKTPLGATLPRRAIILRRLTREQQTGPQAMQSNSTFSNLLRYFSAAAFVFLVVQFPLAAQAPEPRHSAQSQVATLQQTQTQTTTENVPAPVYGLQGVL
ncbi:MAG: hypothetical protein ACREA9_25730, partial [Pyrinomonadaceae bacterium]